MYVSPASVVQEEKMERVLEFLEKPHQASEKDLAAKVGPYLLLMADSLSALNNWGS
jgi:hypothetical protein